MLDGDHGGGGVDTVGAGDLCRLPEECRDAVSDTRTVRGHGS